MSAPRFALRAIELYERPVVLRLPFRFGMVTLERAPQAFVRARVDQPRAVPHDPRQDARRVRRLARLAVVLYQEQPPGQAHLGEPRTDAALEKQPARLAPWLS